MLDLLIRGALVVDGTGAAPRPGNVAVRGGLLEDLAAPPGAPAARVLDAPGLVVCPGFIDVHSHDDLVPFMPGSVRYDKLLQGVTTELTGHCGLGAAPCDGPGASPWRAYVAGVTGALPVPRRWQSFGAYLDDVAAHAPAGNCAALVSHGAVRATVMGLDSRAPTPAELNRMEALVQGALEAGAFGLSVGLQYAPGLWASRDELLRLCRAVARAGGLFVPHVRDHDHRMAAAVEEVVSLAQEAGVQLHVAHMRSYRRPPWRTPVGRLLAALDQARARGVEASFDQHVSTSGSTLLSQLLPPWISEGGPERRRERLEAPATLERLERECGRAETLAPGFDDYAAVAGFDAIVLASAGGGELTRFEGRALADVAATLHLRPWQAVARLLLQAPGNPSIIMRDVFEVADVEALVRHPGQLVGSDGLPAGRPHPRRYGTFPRYLGTYARDRRLLRLEEAVRKVTSLPAALLRLPDRGVLRPGAAADLVLFDPTTIDGAEDFDHPETPPRGIKAVLVGGIVAVEDGRPTGAGRGRVLRRGSGLGRP